MQGTTQTTTPIIKVVVAAATARADMVEEIAPAATAILSTTVMRVSSKQLRPLLDKLIF